MRSAEERTEAELQKDQDYAQRLAKDLKYCINCKQPKVLMVCLTEGGTPTQNFIGVCVNRKCFLEQDPDKLKGWARAISTHEIIETQKIRNARLTKTTRLCI